MIKHEIIRNAAINLKGISINREAVRGIIQDDNMLLMIYSEINGDYKFPGGGIEAGETHSQTLTREIAEECGAHISFIKAPYAEIKEIDSANEPNIDLFKMTSTYYPCQITDQFTALQLDQYEIDLGFHPVWVTIPEAILTNQIVLHRKTPPAPRWTRRDLFVLEQLLAEYLMQ
ncbi:MAG: NUDIX domain-containing protein [Anaerolineaceae bacterium]|nr:NUDIX domain-containing protein [Anaerolineaceae bacterium]